jgi:hypothetical protein
LGDAGGMEGDASANTNGVGGESGEILIFGDIVDNLGCLAESTVDVCGANELDVAIDETGGSEDGKGKIVWKAKVAPSLDYAKPGGDCAECRGWSHVGGAMDSNECLFLVLGLVLLVTPSEIHLLDEIGTAKGIVQSVSTTALTKELEIRDQKGCGVAFLSEFDLRARSDVVFLSPFRKTKTGVNASDEPVAQSMID